MWRMCKVGGRRTQRPGAHTSRSRPGAFAVEARVVGLIGDEADRVFDRVRGG
jgi:hypothetical protein